MASSVTATQRLLTVVAATVIALASGTNYVYSAWAPQFADRMNLSSTESNFIGTAGNIGTYASGVPIGLLIDSKGPRPGTLIGTVALFLGYFPIHRAYASGPGSMSVPVLCFFSFLTGLGSCAAFSASIKTAASNYPHHRGSATAFPLAAFGLSAFFFSTIATFAFHDDTSLFLLALAVGTSSLIFVSSFFVKLLPHPSPSSYATISDHESGTVSQSSELHRTRSQGSSHGSIETTHNSPSSQNDLASSAPQAGPAIPNTDAADETASLITRSSATSDDSFHDEDVKSRANTDSLHADLRGFAMLPTMEFWQLFSLLGLLTGIGLMTINNVGNDVKALWKYYDGDVSPGFLQKQQAIHVSTLSVLSFVGRLISGIGSDFLVKKLKVSRQWCVFVASLFFTAGQFAGTQISNPHHLIIVSGLTGFAYGMLFGVFPSLVAHTFGIGGISQNWGIMTLAAVVGGNAFNLIYGSVYDRNSVILPDVEGDCREGLACYRSAYWVTSYAGIVGALITLWGIWHEKRVVARLTGKKSNVHD
ncbi:conserved hypothetical protein [Uncinocarpus reesii 1704]|uniref:Nodulin-like domain-containing protein n=1 Tax=Uncinocarpus reesii (strain UAMH 1704) TaxID=336963 RepID=C4JVC2_UNCRE|nr:uncharacterized protein UREG_06514 [Uncinocarpus reesii 1704]EEP81649.1 conserved hypothetical protein [Uncinocarpus reesii 1704]